MEHFIKLKYLKLYLNHTVACSMELRGLRRGTECTGGGKLDQGMNILNTKIEKKKISVFTEF